MSRGKKTSEKWIGTTENDSFFALGGNDVCIAGAGNDLVNGGTGGDEIKGGAGNDNLIGGAGDDDITGDAGNDAINGGAGDDTISGGSGDDTINGGAGNDTLDGGSGRDRIFGGAGDDNLSGGTGNDTLDGGIGNDFVSGNKGDDRMSGGLGDDTLDWDDGDGNDVMSGNDGRDTIEVDGSVTRGDNFVLSKLSDNRVFFERTGLDGQPVGKFNLTVDTAELFDVSGDIGNDTFTINDLTGTGIEAVQFDGGEGDDLVEGGTTNVRLVLNGGNGNDTLNSGSGLDTLSGDAGDDQLSGGDGNDTLDGGDGNDVVVGDKGDDRMIGGLGNDTLDWDDGDGNDVMSGNEGRDTIEVDGSVTRGDNFVLGKTADNRAFFERTGLDGQAVGRFNLTVDTAEIFDVSGDVGNDTFIINDVSGTGVELIQFDGGEGNDWVDGRATSTPLVLNGGNGDDVLIGGTGTFSGFVGTIPATLGDTLTGGAGKDKFQFATDPFAGGTPGQNLNRPDVVTDYEIGVDQFVFDKQKFGLNELKFQKGNVAQLTGDSNLLVLEGAFANAGQAAAAIRDNNNLTAGKGVFVYYNSTLGISRVVHSSDLANGGAFSVQANINNLTSSSFQTQFTSADFSLA
jgi:Ca2+-binding RTX toxin-like protein